MNRNRKFKQLYGRLDMVDLDRHEKYYGSLGLADPFTVETKQGNPILLDGTKERPFEGMRIFGKSIQDGTPSPENPVPIMSAGSVMTTGKNVLPPESGAEVHMNISAGTRCFLVTDGTPSNGGNVFLYDAEGNIYFLAIDAGATEDIGSHGVAYNVDIVRFVNKLVPGVNTAMYIGEKLPYEPYTGGVPGVNPYEGEINVTVSDGGTQSQTLILSTPGGLPGIPVSSGGNYTDADGQQWVCDEVDFDRGVYVQRVSTYLIRGASYISNGRQQNPDYFGCNNSLGLDGIGYNKNLMSDKLVFVGIDKNIDGSEITIAPNNGIVVFGLKKSVVSEETIEAVTNYLSENPITILYALKEPVETDLPAEEIAAYKALHTYSPNTTVSNDADTEMEIKYKKYPIGGMS